MRTEEYSKVIIEIRKVPVTIYYRDLGMGEDGLSCFRCIDWHTGEDFEFEEGEEFDVEALLIKHIDGDPIPLVLEVLEGVEYGDGE